MRINCCPYNKKVSSFLTMSYGGYSGTTAMSEKSQEGIEWSSVIIYTCFNVKCIDIFVHLAHIHHNL